MNLESDPSERQNIRLPDPPADPPSDGHRRELESLTDEELVVRHLDGDEHAFQVLARRYEDRLLNWITRRVGDRAEAEDLLQRTFLRVYRHLHRFDPERKFSTWIYTIAGNLVKNVYRNRSRDPEVLFQTLTADREEGDRPLQWEAPGPLPDELARKRDLRAVVDRVIEELPAHHREVFVLREREGMSYQEIADLTGLKLGTVKSRLSRARDQFAERISERLEEPLPA